MSECLSHFVELEEELLEENNENDVNQTQKKKQGESL